MSHSLFSLKEIHVVEYELRKYWYNCWNLGLRHHHYQLDTREIFAGSKEREAKFVLAW